MSTGFAERIADAVLYEGYVLYPYRASAPKNRKRWQIGLITPRSFSEAAASDPWFTQTECLAESAAGATLAVRVRGLHLQTRLIEVPTPGAPAEWRGVAGLTVDGVRLLPWDEAVQRECAQDHILDVVATERCWAWTLDAAEATDAIVDRQQRLAGRFVRTTHPVVACVRVSTEPCGPLTKIRVEVQNVTPSDAATLADRDVALRQSLAGVHVILSLTSGSFVSLLDPPASVSEQAAACVNVHTFPVLVGPPGASGVMLSSPIILYDYPAVAPETQGDLCDGTEIDELLTLRVRTLTDDEKREARATDARAAAIVDRCEVATPAAIGRLHGAIRSFESLLNPADEPSPEEASVDIAGIRIARGSPVRLQPARIVDSIDLCLRGRSGTVSAVYRTLENEPYIAVTVDDDPFGAEGTRYRRALFFRPEELVPIAGGAA